MRKDHYTLHDFMVEIENVQEKFEEISKDAQRASFMLGVLVDNIKSSAHFNLGQMEHYLCGGQDAEEITKLVKKVMKESHERRNEINE